MNELTLTTEQAMALIAILFPLAIYLWHHLGSYEIKKQPSKQKQPSKLTNPNYGAYIQAQSKYYN